MKIIGAKNLVLIVLSGLLSFTFNPAYGGYSFSKESTELSSTRKVKKKRQKSKKRFQKIKHFFNSPKGKKEPKWKKESFFGTIALRLYLLALILAIVSSYLNILLFFAFLACVASLILSIGGTIKDRKKTRARIALAIFLLPAILYFFG